MSIFFIQIGFYIFVGLTGIFNKKDYIFAALFSQSGLLLSVLKKIQANQLNQI